MRSRNTQSKERNHVQMCKKSNEEVTVKRNIKKKGQLSDETEETAGASLPSAAAFRVAVVMVDISP